MPPTPVSLVDFCTSHTRNHRPAAVKLSRLERLIAQFLELHPKSSTHDVLVFLYPNFSMQALWVRTSLWHEISLVLSRMLARNIVEMELDAVHHAHWSLEAAEPKRARLRARAAA